MTDIEIKSFDKPDETRPFEGKGYADVVTLGGLPVARAVFEAGWRWSVNVKPIAGTESCQTHHVGYCLGGRMRVVMDNGLTREFGPGDAMDIPPGHDAETLGDEACVMLDFGEISRYAKRT